MHNHLGQGLSTPRSRNYLRITERFKQIGISTPLSTRRHRHQQSSTRASHRLAQTSSPSAWPAVTANALPLDRPRNSSAPIRSAYVISCDREKENKQKRLAYPSSLAFDIKNSVQIISITSPSIGKALSRDVANHSK